MDEVTAILAGGMVLPPGRQLSDDEQRVLALPNPAHATWRKLRRRYKRMPEPPKTLPSWAELPAPHPWAGAVLLPRRAPGLEGVAQADRTSFPPAATLESAWTLRPYQAAAVQAWEAAGRQGVVQAPCGAGKTVLGAQAIAQTPSPALVLVHTLDLARQWQDRLQAQLGIDATLMGGGERQEPGRITIATFQTLATFDPWALHTFGRRFGLTVVDEAHHVPADTFGQAMLMLPARARLGLTATPERDDGLERLLWWHLGPIVYRIGQEALQDAGVVMPPRVLQVFTGWSPTEEDWQPMVDEACEDDLRNELLGDVVHRLRADGRQILLLTGRVKHAGHLAQEARGRGHRAAELTGRLPKLRRAQVLEAAAAQRLDLVTATSLADEGLDLPLLDALVLALPTKANGRLEQKLGRVMRQADGKREPLVVDLVDDAPHLRRMAQSRVALYRRLGATVTRWDLSPLRRSA